MEIKRNILLSVIAPAYNEEDNIIPLVEAFDVLRKQLSYPMELVIVDDGSTDGTKDRANSMAKAYPFVVVVSYARNLGKTDALIKGISASSGKYIAIFDADLQFDPQDIPPMVEKLRKGADLVAGYKVGKYQKPFVSRIYNFLGRVLFKIPVRDMNAMKVMRREVFEEIPARPDWHRYIVIWAYKHGFRLDEYPVKLRPRMRGKSKYKGIRRVLIGIFDMLSVWFQLTFARRPMLFFGTAGLITSGIAVLLGIIVLILRYVFNLGYRPILTLVAMLANIGVLLFICGFLGEMVEGISERTRRVEKKLQERGVGSAVFYPGALHLQRAYRTLGYQEGDFPESETAAKNVLSLPVFPELTAADRGEVSRAVREAVTELSR